MLESLYFPSSKEHLEKMEIVCDYYIESNLIIKIYNQLKKIFVSLSEVVMNKILISLNNLIYNNEKK